MPEIQLFSLKHRKSYRIYELGLSIVDTASGVKDLRIAIMPDFNWKYSVHRQLDRTGGEFLGPNSILSCLKLEVFMQGHSKAVYEILRAGLNPLVQKGRHLP